MLSQFIDKLKENHQIEHLFWRAEKQENGNIHFHIITDKYIHKDAITKYWNWILKKEGYIDLFKKKFGKDNPPSTHVKGVDSVENFLDYVLKYATKLDEHGKVEGRIYGMTDSLRNIKPFITNPDNQVYEEVDTMIKTVKNKIITEDYATVVLFDKVKVRSFRHLNFVIEYKGYLLKTYDILYNGVAKDEIVKEVKNIVENDKLPEKMCYQYTFFDECPDYCYEREIKFFDTQYW